MLLQPGKEAIYDVTAPNVKISFNKDTQELNIEGSDNVSEVVNIQTTNNKISATDEAGNTTEIYLSSFKNEKHEIELKMEEITQNGITVSNEKTEIKYEWKKKEKTGELKSVKSKAETKEREIETKYNSKKNETVVKIKIKGSKDDKKEGDEKDDSEKEHHENEYEKEDEGGEKNNKKEVLSGLYVVELSIEDGIINMNY